MSSLRRGRTCLSPRRVASIVSGIVLAGFVLGSLSAAPRIITSGRSVEQQSACEPALPAEDAYVSTCPQSLATTVVFSCPLPPLHVVYIQPDDAEAAQWMGQAAARSLDAIEAYGGGSKVGVVHFNRTEARTALQMTTDIARADRVLRRASPVRGYFDVESYDAAASRALGVLRQASTASSRAQATVEPIQVVVWFVAGKQLYTTDGERLLRAAATVKQAGVELRAACPDTDSRWCYFTKQMVDQPDYYTEPPAPDGVHDMLMELLDGGRITATGLMLSESIPTELGYIPGSAIPLPHDVQLGITATTLTWVWTAPTSTISRTITYEVQPVRSGNRHVQTYAVITDRLGSTFVISHTRGVTVSVSCRPTPTTPPSPTPTATPDRSSQGRAYVPAVVRDHAGRPERPNNRVLRASPLRLLDELDAWRRAGRRPLSR